MEALLAGAIHCCVSGEPLEQLGQLADLAYEGEDQGLRIMELAPVAFLGEHPQAVS